MVPIIKRKEYDPVWIGSGIHDATVFSESNKPVVFCAIISNKTA